MSSTGGAARALMDSTDSVGLYPPDVRRALDRDRRYRHVFRTLLPP